MEGRKLHSNLHRAEQPPEDRWAPSGFSYLPQGDIAPSPPCLPVLPTVLLCCPTTTSRLILFPRGMEHSGTAAGMAMSVHTWTA